jgi:hypothetical protein
MASRNIIRDASATPLRVTLELRVEYVCTIETHELDGNAVSALWRAIEKLSNVGLSLDG